MQRDRRRRERIATVRSVVVVIVAKFGVVLVDGNSSRKQINKNTQQSTVKQNQRGVIDNKIAVR